MRDYVCLDERLTEMEEVWRFSNEIHSIDLCLETKKALKVEDQDGWSDEDFYEEGYYDESEREEVEYLGEINPSFL